MHRHIVTCTITHNDAHTHTHTHIRAKENEEKIHEKLNVFQEDSTVTDTVTEVATSMMSKNRELVPGSWSLVSETESVLATGLRGEGWYFQHSGVCRGVRLLGRSAKVKI